MNIKSNHKQGEINTEKTLLKSLVIFLAGFIGVTLSPTMAKGNQADDLDQNLDNDPPENINPATDEIAKENLKNNIETSYNSADQKWQMDPQKLNPIEETTPVIHEDYQVITPQKDEVEEVEEITTYPDEINQIIESEKTEIQEMAIAPIHQNYQGINPTENNTTEFKGEWESDALEESENQNLNQTLENLNFQLKEEMAREEELNTVEGEQGILPVHKDYNNLQENNLDSEEFSFPDGLGKKEVITEDELNLVDLHPDYQVLNQSEIKLPVLNQGKVESENPLPPVEIVKVNSNVNQFNLIHENYQHLSIKSDENQEVLPLFVNPQTGEDNLIATITDFSFQGLNQFENPLKLPDQIEQLNQLQENKDNSLNLALLEGFNLDQPQVILREKELVFTPINPNYSVLALNDQSNNNVVWLESESLAVNDDAVVFTDITPNGNIQWLDIRLNNLISFQNIVTPNQKNNQSNSETIALNNSTDREVISFQNIVTPNQENNQNNSETIAVNNSTDREVISFQDIITPNQENNQSNSEEIALNNPTEREVISFNNLITPNQENNQSNFEKIEISQSTQREVISFNNLITPNQVDDNLDQSDENNINIITNREDIVFNDLTNYDQEDKDNNISFRNIVNSPSKLNLNLISNQIAQSNNQRVTIDGIVSPSLTNSEINNPENTNNQTNIQENIAQENTNNQSINNQSSPIKILNPAPNTLLNGRASDVIVEFPTGTELELKVNGITVDSSLIGRTENNPVNSTTIQTWYGVIFEEGKNILTAEGRNNGVNLDSASIEVDVKGMPTQITLSTVQARIPADGRSTATIRGQLLDEQGNVSNREPIVTLDASAGEFIGVDENPDLPGFQVKARKGEFSAQLRSGINAQTVRINAQTQGMEASAQMQFTTSLRRQTLLTGVFDMRWGARGTNYYDSFRDFLPADQDYSNEVDLTSAFFAQGAVGEWQYTTAFNSDRSLNMSPEGNNRLFRSYEASELAYPVYGDSSSVEVVTPSTDQLYFRLERTSPVNNADPDYFMWGDYNTQEFSSRSQEFSATTRQLHGFKGNFNLNNLQITGFYATNVEGFQRDTISPDGTSGYYFLSRRLVIPGSENVFLEVQDYNSPGKIIERQTLNRGTDYEIDYDRGTLLFTRPIFRTDIDQDGNLLLRQILVTYQYDNLGEEDTSILGGRLVYHFNRDVSQQSWLGATYLYEDKGKRNFELYGVDTLIRLGNNTSLIAEYAHSSNDSEFSGFVQGNAYRMELDTQPFDGLSLRAFYRSAEEGFSNQATSSFVPGQSRYGAEALARLSPTTNFRVRYEHEDNFGVAPRPLDAIDEFFNLPGEPIPGSQQDNSLTTFSVGLQQRLGSASLDLDWIWRDRIDRMSPNALQTDSSQLRTRFMLPITNEISFQAFNETTITAEKDAVFSDRTGFGIDWRIIDGVRLSLQQQWFTAGPQQGQSITNIGLDGTLALGSDTAIKGRYGIVNGLNGMMGQGTIGIDQKWAITPGLRVSLGYERLFSNFFTRTASGTQFTQPYASGQSSSGLGFGDGDSYSIGIEYVDSPEFKASTRFQHRNSSTGSNTVFSADVTGKISPALTALFTYNQAETSNQLLQGIGATRTLRTGLAYRDPWDDTWNGLLKYEYRENPSTIPETILFGRGTGSDEHLFSVEGIYAPSWQWEFYGKYAFRNSTTYLANDLVGSTHVYIGQLRAVYRMNFNTELVAEGRLIGQPSAGYTETGLLLEAGYYLTPDLRLSAGYAFGEIDDRDFSGSRAADGFYMGLTFKLDGLLNMFGQPRYVAPPQYTEAQVKENQTDLPRKDQQI
jgi:hypothetical protein